ncbi:MAG: hypothetical protein OWR62_12345 [Sulfobacillus thermotolerans]|uniref:Uncharacterized protein n=1 Tax=Sulfobacillus thermotolerans TaxID=338644 RepID=A0ABM6RUL2_9FIRM|nr:hypothetical protein BXT84_15330 [Sulfobacillus thermotolerans]MCY0909168.1 hypothetical protein [Sulfobacillus thermotolerans]
MDVLWTRPFMATAYLALVMRALSLTGTLLTPLLLLCLDIGFDNGFDIFHVKRYGFSIDRLVKK